jgi:hypothetical protein
MIGLLNGAKLYAPDIAAAAYSHGDLIRTIDLDVDIGADAVDYKSVSLCLVWDCSILMLTTSVLTFIQ